MKPDKEDEAQSVFAGTGVALNASGKRYLGGALGQASFEEDFLREKVEDFVSRIKKLARASIAKTQPQAAYAAFTFGEISRWTYSLRVSTITSDELFQPLEEAVTKHLIPAPTDQHSPGMEVRSLLALPSRLGGMGIINPTEVRSKHQRASQEVCAPLVKNILDQQGDPLTCQSLQASTKARRRREKRVEETAAADNIIRTLLDRQRQCVKASQERGASLWLSVIPLERHGFVLHKSAFRDAIALRYGWPLRLAPQSCRCGKAFDVDHVLICKLGGFHTLRHNDLRDTLAGVFREVSSDVAIKPRLQPLNGEILPRLANKEDEARLDIRARGFWDSETGRNDAFFDVRVFPGAPSYQNQSLSSLYRQHECKKRLAYGRRVLDVERGTFTPLVFTSGGGISKETTTAMKRLAHLVSDKRTEPYSIVMGWLRCKATFSSLRSALACLRGSMPRTRNSDFTSISEAAAGGQIAY